MNIMKNKVAPLALTVALAFGVGACENTEEGIEQDTQDAEEELEEGEQELEEDAEEGADELEEETDEEATDEG